MRLIFTILFFSILTTAIGQDCKDTTVHYKFINNKVKYPRTAVEANIQGQVIVTFDVDSTCSLVNRRVTKSIGYGCDEEAIKSFDAVEKQLKIDHNSKCCSFKDIKVPVKFKIK